MLTMKLYLLVLATILICSNVALSGNANDRIDSLLSQMIDMGKNVKMLRYAVEKVVDTEEQVEEKVVKMEDALWKMKKEMAEMKTEITKENQKTRANIFPFGLIYYGRNAQGSSDDSFDVSNTPLQKCAETCQQKRATDGAAWNDLAS